MHRSLLLASVAALAVVLAPPVGAQGVELGVGAGYYTLSGDDFEGADAGLGVEIAARMHVSPQFQLGVVVQRNSHYIEFIDDDAAILAIIAEPRYRFSMANQAVVPFLGARIGWARETATIYDGAASADASTNGYVVGALGGMAFELNPAVSLETSVVMYQVSFGDVEVDGETIEDTDASGSSLGFRIGLNWRPGGAR